MDATAGLVLFLIFCLSYLIVTYGKMMKGRNLLPPGPTPLPFIGNLLQVRVYDIANSLMKLHRQYGSLYSLYLGPQRYVVLCGYKTMKEALIDRAEEFSGRAHFPLFYNYTKGNGIAFSQGRKWKELRRFTISGLAQFGMGKRSIEERIQEEVQYLVQRFKDMGGSPFNPEFLISKSVCNIISSILFGNRFDYDDEDLVAMTDSVKNIFATASSTCGMLYHVFPGIMDHLPGRHQQMFKSFQALERFILKRAKMNQKTLDPANPRDLLDIFLIKIEQEKDNPSSFFNWKSLAMSSITLTFAGTESVSTTLRFCFLYLMKNPDVQEKVHEEIDRVIGDRQNPSYHHRSQMPYTQAVIHELQRIADISPMSLPHSLTRDTELGGYKFQKGTVFIPLLNSVHFDPTQYEHPEIFDPKHFLDENGCFHLNPAFLPFSAGKRVCLGANLATMEVFLYFTTILKNFKLEPLVKPEEVDVRPIGVFLANLPRPFMFSLIPR
ncbi:cytochrome P450 2F2-like [Ambystoma mexicanum]|uniref:cytochrome P450 2F2-like n=1 Tax=Ambystoma mexicanum TaxID=8296 RepID=UPI0037E96ECD